MFANSSKYAIRAIIHLINNSSKENKLQAKFIAESTQVPKPFLSKILQTLATNGYLTSTKGPKGGFYLSESQLENSLLDIIIQVEGKDRMRQCALNFDKCDTQSPCPIHDLIANAKSDLRQSYKCILLIDLRKA